MDYKIYDPNAWWSGKYGVKRLGKVGSHMFQCKGFGIIPPRDGYNSVCYEKTSIPFEAANDHIEEMLRMILSRDMADRPWELRWWELCEEAGKRGITAGNSGAFRFYETENERVQAQICYCMWEDGIVGGMVRICED